MASFNSIVRKSFNLYRGSHGAMSRTIMSSVGVAPVRVVAEIIFKNPSLIPKGDLDTVIEMLLSRLGLKKKSEAGDTTMQGFLPNEPSLDKLERILAAFPATAQNPLTTLEHVMWETGFNSPSTSRLIESTSKNPQTGILYAYGIDPDSHVASGPARFPGGSRNTDAFVAVMQRPEDDELAVPCKINFADTVFTIDDCRIRIHRDQEVLVRDVAAVADFVSLPPFDETDPMGSLDKAAEKLVKSGWADG